MLLIISLILLSIHTQIHADNSCETHISDLETCSAVISFSGNCQSMLVNLGKTKYANCTTNQFFWSYPLNNLTLIIETPMTYERKSFTISLMNEELAGAINHVYRIIHGKESDVTTHEKILRQDSDENFQVILKFQGPKQLSRYGVNIDYSSA